MGAMIFGGVAEDQLQLNESTLCSNEPGNRDSVPLDVTKEFDRVWACCATRQYAEAGDIITKNWGGRSWDCYQPLGDLHLHFDRQGEFSDYARELNLATATARASYKQGGVTFTREYLASHPDQVIVVRLSSSAPGALSLRTVLGSVHPTAKLSVSGKDEIVMKGQAPGFVLRRTLEWVEKRGEQWKYPQIWDKDGKRRPFAKTVLYGDEVDGLGTFFEARVRAVVRDGQVEAKSDGLHISKASEVLLYISAATSYNGFNKSPSREGVDPSIRTKTEYQCRRAQDVRNHPRRACGGLPKALQSSVY